MLLFFREEGSLMKRKIVTLLFVCCLGISTVACGNEVTDTKDYGETSNNELAVEEEDSDKNDYVDNANTSSSVGSSTSSSSRYNSYSSSSSNSTSNNSSEETHGYDPSDPYYSAHDADGDGQLTDEEWSAAMGDFIDDLAEQMGIE